MARIALLSAALAALVLAAGAGATSRPPALTLAAQLPRIVVHGSGFHPRERVTVIAGLRTVHVRATRLGSFVVDTGLTVSRCTAPLVRAVGALGDAALLKLPQPACMPARAPNS
jgi:hypothetical protein